jgi:DNA (cytosine-5)-methyltransferase 1
MHGDIAAMLDAPAIEIPEADLVVGGPPCQGFSLLNKRRDGDPRKLLWRPFLEIIRRSGASVFVMENVPQLLGSPEHAEIVASAEDMGFRVVSDKLCAADYGVPQIRTRAFVVGCRFANPAEFFPPPKTHSNPRNGSAHPTLIQDGRRVWATVRDAVGDLPLPAGTEIRQEPPPLDLHFGRNPTAVSVARYLAIPDEGMNRFDLQKRAPAITPKCWVNKASGGTDLFGRLWWDRPAYTIRTEFYKPEKGRYLHPEQHRPITHREAARFQSFPDAFVFTGSKVDIARQIGNAVPPLLATSVARTVLALFDLSRRP